MINFFYYIPIWCPVPKVSIVYYSAKLYAGIQYVDVLLAWQNQKVALVDSNVPDELSEIFRGNGWLVYQCDAVDLDEMKHRFEE